MNLSFTISERDYFRFKRYQSENRPQNLVVFAIILMLALGIIGSSLFQFFANRAGIHSPLTWITSLDLGDWLALFALLLTVLLCLSLLLFFLFRLVYFALLKLELKTGRTSEFLGTQEIEFLEESIHVKNSETDLFLLYGDLRKILFLKGDCYLYFGKNRALLLPQNAFLQPGSLNEFLGLLYTRTGLLPVKK